MGAIEKIEESQFDTAIAKGVVLVDFFADWCGPCRNLVPILEKISDVYAQKVKVIKVDIDAARGLATRFGISSIPTLILFQEGKVKEMMIGLRSFADLSELIDRSLTATN